MPNLSVALPGASLDLSVAFAPPSPPRQRFPTAGAQKCVFLLLQMCAGCIGVCWGSADALAVLLSGAALGAHEAARISHRSLSAAAKREKSKACVVAQCVVRMHKLVSFRVDDQT